MSSEIISIDSTWNSLITAAIDTQRMYFDLTEEQFDWLKSNLIKIYSKNDNNFDIETKFISLVLLNRSTKYGRYALLFNQSIEEAIINNDIKALARALKNPNIQELDALSSSEKTQWISEIHSHIIAHNLYLDRELLSKNQPYGSEYINTYAKCYNEACIAKSNIYAEYIPTNSAHVVSIADVPNYMEIYLMREIDLIFLLLSEGLNPYSGEFLSKEIITNLKKKYTTLLTIARKAHNLGYKHEYKI